MSDNYVSPEALRQLQQTGQTPTIIDVRGEEEYLNGHIPGALHIPADELPHRLAELPPDQPIITY
jgi:rhodanese-related sulfurtransferase